MAHFLEAHQGCKHNEKFNDLREKTGSSYRTEGYNGAQRPVKGSKDTSPVLSASCSESSVNRVDMSLRKPEAEEIKERKRG